ncbi:hypothetical protein TNCV_3503721 [Trichonephila clavipes]|uniref:Uncharacterized protein n=1 Tax=Trichonephila clavipes TaxID=2585209 RepID=A0A8X6RYG9_TRICX|nr:hypothetical protein TNCV_3503721 [Trichonephila clavipes]
MPTNFLGSEKIRICKDLIEDVLTLLRDFGCNIRGSGCFHCDDLFLGRTHDSSPVQRRNGRLFIPATTSQPLCSNLYSLQPPPQSPALSNDDLPSPNFAPSQH